MSGAVRALAVALAQAVLIIHNKNIGDSIGTDKLTDFRADRERACDAKSLILGCADGVFWLQLD